MLRSDSFTEISKALAAVQKNLRHAKKSSDNPYFKSKYADLAEVWDTIRDLLAANGLAVWQIPGYGCDNSYVSVETVICHTSGEWVACTLSGMPARKDNESPTPQAIGSTITYLRRYALSAMIGVSPDDDDGNAASGVQLPKQGPQKQADTKPPAEEKPAAPKEDAKSAAPKGGKVPKDDKGRVLFAYDDKGNGQLCDERQQAEGCIITSQWRELEEKIKVTLGGNAKAFGKWLMLVYKVKPWDIRQEMYDGIMATVEKNPAEVMKQA